MSQTERLANEQVVVTGAKVEPEYTGRRDNDNIRRRVGNIQRIRREPRWIPSVTIERGLRCTYEWLAENAKAASL